MNNTTGVRKAPKDTHVAPDLYNLTNDIHGYRSVPGRSERISMKHAKVLREAQRGLAPKATNGITCPYSYYHILDGILSVPIGQMFTANGLTKTLEDRPLRFDPTTVGRIIADIAESLRDANGIESIKTVRYWDGRRYFMDDSSESWIALENLLDDLRLLCVKFVPDTNSPLYRCSSVNLGWSLG